MPIVGQFGKLSGSITIAKGVPFNEFWEEDVAPGSWISVYTVTVPSAIGAPSWYINCIHATGRVHCRVKLTVGGVDKYVGRMNLVTMNLTDRFDDGEIVAAPGDAVELLVYHEWTELLVFSGNLSGYKR
jgi:hypothetical protein